MKSWCESDVRASLGARRIPRAAAQSRLSRKHAEFLLLQWPIQPVRGTHPLIKNTERSKPTRCFRINESVPKMAKSKPNQTQQEPKANAASHLESEDR
jgi:hypothetical protein